MLQRMRVNWIFYIFCWWKCKLAKPLWKNSLSLFCKRKCSTVLLLDLCPRETLAYLHQEIWPKMFVAALFIEAKSWGNKTKVWGRYILAYLHNAVLLYNSKKNYLQLHRKVWVNLSNNVLCEKYKSKIIGHLKTLTRMLKLNSMYFRNKCMC